MTIRFRMIAAVAAFLFPALAAAQTLPNRTRPELVPFGVMVTQPVSGSVDVQAVRGRGDVGTVRLDFTFNQARLTVTDAAASGSSGSLKIFTFIQQAIAINGCRQDYTAFAEGSALDTGAGDAAFKMGLGTVAADAGDGALTSTEVDVCAITGTITLSGGTGAGTASVAGGTIGTALDGTTTAKDVYLNWSGTAATVDANSTIDVTGTVSVYVVMLGDD